eukprot:8303453-Alexandrium_andersonii.AAC.1
MIAGGEGAKLVGEALVLGTVQDGHAVGAPANVQALKRAKANKRTAARASALPCSIEYKRRRFLACAAPKAARVAFFVGLRRLRNA